MSTLRFMAVLAGTDAIASTAGGNALYANPAKALFARFYGKSLITRLGT